MSVTLRRLRGAEKYTCESDIESVFNVVVIDTSPPKILEKVLEKHTQLVMSEHLQEPLQLK